MRRICLKTVTMIAALEVVTSTASSALTDEQLSTLKQNLTNSDPVVRREALRELGKHQEFKSAGNAIVPLLSSALADQDAKVRANAAATLAMISFVAHPKFQEVKEGVTDLRSYPPLQSALLAAGKDLDEETRKNALAAYLMTFRVSPAVQDELVSRYEAERPFSIFRNAILEALTIDGEPTAAAKALLIRVADNPDESVILAQVILDAKRPPLELLPHFAHQFEASTESARREMFGRAIEKYGAAARPYLPMLQSAADREPNAITKQNLLKAVATIQAD